MNKLFKKREKITPECKEVRTDIMRYVNNKISFFLCILAIIADVAMFLVIYSDKNCTSDFQLGIDLLVNVIFLLACFLLAEKTKVYDPKAGLICYVVAAVQIIRIFWIPTYYHNCYNDYLAAASAAEAAGEALSYSGVIGLTHGKYAACIILFVVSAVSLIGAGVICRLKQRKLAAHLKAKQEAARGN